MENKNDSLLKKVVEEIGNNFQTMINQNSSNIIVQNKFNNFHQNLEEKISKTCADEIAELNKHVLFETKEGQMQFKILPGKEKEAESAIENFNKCQSPFLKLIVGINSINELNNSVISGSTSLCIEDCSNKYSGEDDLRNCVKNCFDFSYKYTLKATDEILSQQLNEFSQQLNKI